MLNTTPPAGIRFAFSLLLLFNVRFLLADVTQANALFQQGRVDEATASLREILAAQPGDAQAHQLLCRIDYAQEMADHAIHECELAVSSAPASSDNQMWLGRAYGFKASHANPFSALGLAIKVRTAFERAVQLDPENIRAMSDLGEFYVAAPSIIGGGLDKARALAAQMQPHFPSQAHRLLALIAEKKKEDALAETEFSNAVAAGRTPDAYIDLGQFYQRHNQPDKMLNALQSGVAVDRRKGPALVDAASILTDAHRAPELAETLLRTYLSSSAKTDDAPAFKVHVQLGDLLAHQGDPAAAHREYAAALALASNYVPARKAMQGS
ncbi:MAG TPA: tetratricopeptide repeat protein [Edaphobacter sp.]|jgi:tetratricopeptide (TPR) repeat protein|nr:tetratricopeptide repeat protein [Edaphobacter sp.]